MAQKPVSDRPREVELEGLRRELEEVRAELAAFDHWADAIGGEVETLLRSWRWRTGSALVELARRLLGGRGTPAYVSRLRALLRGIETRRDERSREVFQPIDAQTLQRRIEAYQSSTRPKTAVIYTAITGSYDVLRTPEHLDPRCDYVCFTDAAHAHHPVWQLRPTAYHNVDATRAARYYKLHPHFFFADYEIAIWIDANILIRGDISSLIDRFRRSGAPLGAFPHLERSCTYEEAAECIRLDRDRRDVILRQMSRYRAEGFPRGRGLPENNLLVSRPGDRGAREVFSHWWRELDNGSRRDQLSIMYVLWKLGLEWARITDNPLWNARFDRERFWYFPHHEGVGSDDEQRGLSSRGGTRVDAAHAARPGAQVSAGATVDVIVPVHDALRHVKRCLRSVVESLPARASLIIVDDGSGERTCVFLAQLVAQLGGRARLIRHASARGYTKAANAGLRASSADSVILLNSDTIVPRSWIGKLVDCAASAEEIGVVGPLSNAASWQSVPRLPETRALFKAPPLPDGLSVDEVDLLCDQLAAPVFPRVQLLNGFCLCIKRSALQTIGLFDEVSYPQGYGEENDYCFRATDLGFELAVATNTYVFHAKTKSHTMRVSARLRREGGAVFQSAYGDERIRRATRSIRSHPLLVQQRAALRDELAFGSPLRGS